MHIIILTIGTRGDVQPYLALGLGLQQAGYKVTIGAPDNFEDFITGHGLNFQAIGSDYEKVIKSEAIEILSSKKRGVLKFWRALKQIKKETAQYHTEAYRAMWSASQDAEILILQTLTLPAVDFAEKLNIPVFYAGLQPATPTSEFPLIAIPLPSMGSWLNKASYRFLPALNQIPRKIYNQLRQELLGYDPKPHFFSPLSRKNNPIATLYGFSPHLVSRPKDWPDNVKICGFWFLEDQKDWQPDEKLQQYLDDGEAPVFIGFSSLTWQAEHHTKIIVEAVKQWGGRALIATGWGGLDPERFCADLPNNIFVLKHAPHSKLFPLMAAIVHHGGAGSTGAALLAGKPTLICPDMVDQPFWASQVYKSGLGPKPLPLSRLTSDILAQQLEDLTTQTTYQKKAVKIAQKVKEEDGVKTAVNIITKARPLKPPS